jgi:putative membrane protein
VSNEVNSAGKAEGILRDHLANERTLLAWTRTALAVAALGFVVAKVRFTAVGANVQIMPPEHAFSRTAGAAFVLGGLLMEIVGIWRYLDLRGRLRGYPFRPSGWAMLALNAAMGLAILFLLVYLLVT